MSPCPFTLPSYLPSLQQWVTGLLMVLLGLSGCTRLDYRKSADAESYCLIESRQSDPRWEVPNRGVEPRSHSRMYMAAEQDCGPKPLDDPAASCYMDRPNCIKNTAYYGRIPSKANTENPVWVDYLPRDENGKIELTQSLAVDLSLMHSRDFQTQFENVYLTALDLSGNRFEFAAQWFGGFGADFTATGADLGNQRLLNVTADRLGFTRNLPGGGQFATSILNSLFWDFGSSGLQGGSASLVTTFTQPLLRGAFRHVRLETLTQAERNLLYAVRAFARFRRTFYVDIMTDYLSLLTQLQAIRNLHTNVDNLRQNLIEHEFYVQLEMVSQIQRDQVFQEYQNGRLSLLAAEQNLAESLDVFKFRLGLPAWVPLEVDESLLEPFELVNPELVELQDAAQQLYESLVQYLPPQKASKQFLLESFETYTNLRQRVATLVPTIDEELDRWVTRLEQTDEQQLGTDDRLDLQQQVEYAKRVEDGLAAIKDVLKDREAFNDQLKQQLQRYDLRPLPEVDDSPLGKPAGEGALNEVDGDPNAAETDPEILAWQAMMQAVGEQLREEIAELYVTQTLVRLFLIDIQPLPIREHAAITYAHQNRVDLMNSQAVVMDAFRGVEVAADALESDLSLSTRVEIGSDPNRNNAYRLDSSSASSTVGVEFDGPLNRLNERNDYRAAQVAYQQASREFMADKDQVANEVRSVLRQLELSRLNFQIARQQLVAATRQFDEAQLNLRRSAEPDSNLTIFLLTALQGVLDAKNNLISNWISYRVQTMRLFTALDLLYLDETGHWINEESGLKDIEQLIAVDPEYFPPQWVTATVFDNGVDTGVDKAEDLIEPSVEDGQLPQPDGGIQSELP